MRRYVEQRGRYAIACYEVEVSGQMRDQALDFARRIILTNNQYSRLLPSQIRASGDVSMQQKIEIQRTYMGKLGELAFARFLQEMGKPVDMTEMFAIYVGQENVDACDFRTRQGHSVDVKTGFRRIHTRLLVNVEQFDNNPKEYYVAVKLDAVDVDSRQKLVDWEHISAAHILGYAEYQYMRGQAEVRDFGEGNARCIPYDRLLGINRLVNEF